MNEHEVYELAKKHICKEIESVLDQIEKNGAMSDKDLERLDKLYHTKKDLLATHGMEHPDEYYDGSMSGRRGRGADGRYVSMDYDPRSYAGGYSQYYPRENPGWRGPNW